MNLPVFHDWAVVGLMPDSLYLAPEQLRLKLTGKVFGHPDKEDGKYIVTSTILSSEGRIVTTRSRDYRLGTVSKDYRKFLKKAFPGWDWRKPMETNHG